jgi:predicted AAA+ superfamily ATPase
MKNRLLSLPENYSFFLFGARGVGKSTLIRKNFSNETSFWIDLLKPLSESRYAKNPDILIDEVRALPDSITHIVIDEIQKVPKLLDVVHSLIESTNKFFILTGSSARRLKIEGANLLAGRAFVKKLFPFSFLELEDHFNLDEGLSVGMLPKIWDFNTKNDQYDFLEAYAYTYLKEEVWAEHLVNKLEPFRKFLEVAAQSNGKLINYANIARDCGCDDKTVRNYFTILEDTWVGFLLEPYQHSFRKRLSQVPKFYFFDLGVARALARTHRIPLLPQTFGYGDYFEQFIITEIYKLCQYFHPDYRLSFIRTKDDLEVDLVVERPGLRLLLIEIKSATQIDQSMLSALFRVKKDIPEAEYACFSNDPISKIFENGLEVFYWKSGLLKYFGPF